MNKKVVIAEGAPKAIGPYSAGILIGDFIFTSGQLGISPITGSIVEGGIEEETKQALENLNMILQAAGSNLRNVVKTTVFLKNMDDFAKMNEVYAKYFSEKYPARSAFQVARLPKDGLVEIEAIAFLDER